MHSAAGIGVEVAQGDLQLHQELAAGGGRPQSPAFGSDVDHGRQQPAG